MPTIELSKKELEKYVGKKVDGRLLKEKISMLGTDLEGIEGDVIDVEIFPNRPDLLSQPGFSRAIGYFMGLNKKIKKYKSKKSDYVMKIDRSVKNVRPYTCCAVVKGLKFDDTKIKEVIQIQEKLHVTFGRNRKKCAIGIYPLEKIEWPIKYYANEPEKIKFVPLEEKKEMNAVQILSRTKVGRDYGDLLEGLEKYPIFEDAKGEILSMPPIINSHTVGKINEKTKDVFIECSGFDYETLSECLNMIVCALSDMKGEIYEVRMDYPEGAKRTPNLKDKKMKIDYNLTNKRLGLKLTKKEIKDSLLKMGIETVSDTALIPPYRTGFFSFGDVIEQVAIGYGYDKFEGTIPELATVGEENGLDVFKRKVSEMLIGLGFYQVNTLHLVSKEQVEGEDTIKLLDAVSSGYDHCRNEMIDSILDVFRVNRSYEYPQKIFDAGIVFLKKGKKVVEVEKLCCGIAGDVDYTSIRQIMDYLGKRLGLDLECKEAEDEFFIEGRSAKIMLNGKEIGRIGEVNPKKIDQYSLEVPVSILEVDVESLFLSTSMF